MQNNNNVSYFDSFGAEDIPKKIKAFINNNNNNKKHNNKYFQSISIYFDNVWIFLYWFY